MANYKRKKPRRQVKCTLCTDSRFGNSMKNTTKQTRLIKLRVTECPHNNQRVESTDGEL